MKQKRVVDIIKGVGKAIEEEKEKREEEVPKVKVY